MYPRHPLRAPSSRSLTGESWGEFYSYISLGGCGGRITGLINIVIYSFLKTHGPDVADHIRFAAPSAGCNRLSGLFEGEDKCLSEEGVRGMGFSCLPNPTSLFRSRPLSSEQEGHPLLVRCGSVICHKVLFTASLPLRGYGPP